jgi:hypothetical protein
MYDIGALLGRHEVRMDEGRARPKEALFLLLQMKASDVFILGKGSGLKRKNGDLYFLFFPFLFWQVAFPFEAKKNSSCPPSS